MRSAAFTAGVALMAALLWVAPTTGAAAADRVRDEDASATARWTGLFRARAGFPQTLSGGVGALRFRLPEAWECVATCPFRGWLFQAEPGIHGAQVSVGYATLMAEKRDNPRFLADVYVGYGVKAVLLRTWGGANVTPPEQNFGGLEFSFTVTRINFSVATLRRIGGDGEADWLLSGGVGWGF